MALGKDYTGQQCTMARTLEIVGERWTLLVVRDAFYGVRRYNDFLSHLGMPRAVLAARLRDLTEAGVLRKHRYQSSPPRDEYLLTEAGLKLWPILYGLSRWGAEHLTGAPPMREFRHLECGSRLGGHGECPRCGVELEPGDIEVRPGPGLDREPADPVGRALLKPHRLTEPLTTG